MNTDENLKLIKYQEYATIAYEIVLLFSFLLLYDQEKTRKNKKRIFNDEQRYTISVITRIVIIGITLVFLYSNMQNYKITKENDEDTTFVELQILGSILILIAALIALYVTIKNKNTDTDLPDYDDMENFLNPEA